MDSSPPWSASTDPTTITTTTTSSSISSFSLSGTIVVVAKCPFPGQCKTRLIPFVGPDGAATLARAMLCDVLETVSLAAATATAIHDRHPLSTSTVTNTTIQKILLYAPPTPAAKLYMEELIREITTLAVSEEDPTNDQQTNHSDPSYASSLSSKNSPSSSSSSSSPPWRLLPMLDSTDLQSSDLSAQLTHALKQARYLQQDEWRNHATALDTTSSVPLLGPVMFVGMDTPEQPIDEIHSALRLGQAPAPPPFLHPSPPSNPNSWQPPPTSALLCPAADGGYGLLSLPCTIAWGNEQALFYGVCWSHALTAVSQLKALTDAVCDSGSGSTTLVRIGRLMYDIDDEADVRALCQRLQQSQSLSGDCWSDKATATTTTTTTTNAPSEPPTTNVGPCLLSSSSGQASQTGICRHTRQALQELGLLL